MTHPSLVPSRSPPQVKTRWELRLEKLQDQTLVVLDHRLTLLVVFLMTFWALFADDILYGTPLDKQYDLPFAYASLCFFIIFMIELTARTIVQFHEYAFTFFWFMELVANLSMILSLGPIMNADNANSCRDEQLDLSNLSGFAAGSRLARVMRLLRVIRVLRVFASCNKQRNEGSAVVKNQQSLIGKALNEKLVRSMILIVIVLQLVFPMVSLDEVDDSRKLAFDMLLTAKQKNYSTFPSMYDAYRQTGENIVGETGDYTAGYIVLLKTLIGGEAYLWDKGDVITANNGYPYCFTEDRYAGAAGAKNSFYGCPDSIAGLRCSEVQLIASGDDEAWWNTQRLYMENSQLNITLTCLLTVIIISMYTALSTDVTSMVVQPIESMVGMVQMLATNPNYQLEGQSKSKYETEAVRIALAKIVGLMQLGFGGAGHEIISVNLANSEGAELDLMRPGKKKDCAYGFCDIRQFTDTVECLQDQVMIFTNSVGEIVHQSCHDNRGEPNKNIGDAFLIVWRPKSEESHAKVVDGALTAFRRCVREVASSQTLQLVTNVDAIHKKFGPGKYRTKLGFGLHFGWSVEGPVGSPTKIDCSYLSPEVKISDRLEAATKIYSSNILMSGQFYDLLSDHIKVGIRLIDHVTFKNSNKPMRIYADDRSNLWLKINPRLVEIYGADAAYEQFSKTFHEGVDCFIKGDWPTAQQKLEGARDFCPKDAPTLLLMKEMKKQSIDATTPTAPVHWKGYHESDV